MNFYKTTLCQMLKNLHLVKKLWIHGVETFFIFSSFFKQSNVSKSDSNINCRSTKNKQLCQVWRVLLKKCACHALEKFEMVKGVAGYLLSYHFKIWQKVEILWVQKLVKIWCWYLKPLLSNSKSTKIYHLP